MPLLYKPFQSVLKTKDGQQLFYPRVVLKGSVSTDQIAQEISEYSSLTKGDTKNTLDNLIKVMTTHLHASESVLLDGLGSFHLAMKSTGKGVESKDKVSPAQATITVRFQPTVTLNSNRTVATRALVTGVKCLLYEKDSSASSGGNNPGGGNAGGGSDGDESENPLG